MKRGEIWLIDLDPTIGAEIQKTRPGIIVNDDELGILPLRIIIPITDWKDRYGAALWIVKIESNNKTGLTKASAADCFQIRSISKERFVRKLGAIDINQIVDIEYSLSKVLSIPTFKF
jgi:mRNA interferase MazF